MSRPVSCVVLAIVMAASAAIPLAAHVGSPDVYFEGNAGPYRLLVAIRTPPVVPGVAGIEVRVLEGEAREVRVVPLRLTGPGAEFAPVPDLTSRSADDPRFFTANLWMMTSGPWRVRIAVDGNGGRHEVAVPVDAVASRKLDMPMSLRLVLAPLAAFLVLGVIAIAGASAGEAQVEPGAAMPPHRRRRALVSRLTAAVFVAVIVVAGNWWWTLEANAYERYIYKPMEISAAMQPDSRLRLTLRDPGWLSFRVSNDLVPDHGHLMHLFLVREPSLDRLLHLHPRQLESGEFDQALPEVESGRYRVFADIVHGTGFPETMVTNIELARAGSGGPGGDDSGVEVPARVNADSSSLADGGRMLWDRTGQTLRSKQPQILTFKIQDAAGQPAKDLEPYMGMPGHAIVFKRDLSVFAHIHPSGTAPMPSLALASVGLPEAATQSHEQHTAHVPAWPSVVTFPYGFPSDGAYRIFVQVKRAGRVQTGVFDVRVE
jgi:hypothetical protein